MNKKSAVKKAVVVIYSPKGLYDFLWFYATYGTAQYRRPNCK